MIRRIGLTTILLIAVLPALWSMNIDSLEKALPDLEGQERFTALNNLTWHFAQRIPDKALTYGAESYTLAKSLGQDSLIALAARDWGATYLVIGKLDTAESLMLEAIELYGPNAGADLANCQYRLCAIYLSQQRYPEALEQLQPALDYFEAHELKTYLMMVPALSMVYRNMAQDSMAIATLEKALELNAGSDAPDEINEAFIRGNLAKILAQPGQHAYEEAIGHLQKAVRIFTAVEMHSPLRQVLSDLGASYSDIARHDSAVFYGLQALEWAEKLDMKEALMFSHQSVGISYERMGELGKAHYHLSRALSLGEDVEDQTAFLDLYQAMAAVEEQQANYQSALDWLGKAHEIQDTIYQQESLVQLNDMQVKYETAKATAELAEEKLKSQQQQSFIRALTGGILALLLIGAIGYFLVKSQQKRRLQASLIEEQEKGIQGIITAIEAERKRIAKDLHDGVGQQLSALKMGFQRLSTQLPAQQMDQAEGLQVLLDQTAKETRSISHQMMPMALTELGLVPAIEDALQKSLGQTGIQYTFEYFKLEERYPEQIEVAVYRILQELVNNVIKHADADQLDIQLFQNGLQLILIVEDNGKGVQMPSGDGQGMFTIRNRLNPFKGRFNLESSQQQGTTATIAIPLKTT